MGAWGHESMDAWARPRARARSRGVIFVTALILLAGMSVVIVSLAYEVSLDLKMATNLLEGDQTLEVAKVGIDNVLYLINNDANWRTNYTSGTWITDKAVGGGTFTASVVDDDGSFTDWPIDTMTVRSVASYGGTRRTVSATLIPPAHPAMLYLACMWSTGDKLEIENAPRVFGDLCSNNEVKVNGSAPDLRGDIYARDTSKVTATLDDADTDIIRISPTPAQPPVDFNWLIARGSQLNAPVVSGVYVVSDKVISPTSNPYGFANANGIYYVTGDKDIRFTRCYIAATIVATTGKNVYFDKASVHAPAFAYYPALVSDKEVHYSFDQNLSESESNVDFNNDGDKTDTLTPSVSGVVYAQERINGLQETGGTNIVRFKGALISKRIKLIGSGCIFEQDASLATNLVNQFQDAGMKVVKGSFKSE